MALAVDAAETACPTEAIEFLLAGSSDPGNPSAVPIQEIAQWTQEGLVTVLGPGGIGKTRIAIEVAHGQSDETAFADLATVTSPDLVESASYEIYLGGSVSGDSTTGLYNDDYYSPGTLVGTVTAS